MIWSDKVKKVVEQAQFSLRKEQVQCEASVEKLGREEGCKIIQLTTNKERVDAKRFYEKLGFQATHEGMKLYL